MACWLIISLLIVYALQIFHIFLMHGFDTRFLNKVLKMLLLMTFHCMDTPYKFYTSNLSWTGKNITFDNCLHSLRNLLIDFLLSLNFKVLEYTPLEMLTNLLFLLVCSNIHNQWLYLHFSQTFIAHTFTVQTFITHIVSLLALHSFLNIFFMLSVQELN